MNARLRLVSRVALVRLVSHVALVLAVCTLGACARTHLTVSHGRAYHETFAVQDANPDRKGNKSIHGLDSQEAAIIAGNYRRALSPKQDTGPTSNRMLMVDPNRAGGNDSAQLSSSVPQGN